MASMNSVPSQQGCHHDELFMQQSMHISEILKDLKNLRKQLHSAADYFENIYSKEDDKHTVMEATKDYVTKALINSVDHLGFVAYKTNELFDEKIKELSATELRISCIEKRLRTCREFTDRAGLFEQAVAVKFSKYHKRYALPGKCETADAFEQARSLNHSGSFYDAGDPVWCRTAAQGNPGESHPPFRRRRDSIFHTQLSDPTAPEAFRFTRIASLGVLDKGDISPNRLPLLRSGPSLKRSTSPFSTAAKLRNQLQPRRTASLPIAKGREVRTGIERNPSRGKRFLKSFLSMGKSSPEWVTH